MKTPTTPASAGESESERDGIVGSDLVSHTCSLALGFGATGRDDVRLEYIAAKDRLTAEFATLRAALAAAEREGDEARAANDVFDAAIKSAKATAASLSKMREALVKAQTRMRNCRGAVESNQVADKDVHGSLSRGIAEIDAALEAP